MTRGFFLGLLLTVRGERGMGIKLKYNVDAENLNIQSGKNNRIKGMRAAEKREENEM